MHEEKKMPGVLLYWTDLELMEKMLNEKECLALLRAIKLYIVDGQEPALQGAAHLFFLFLKERADRDMRAYREKCEINRRNANKRWARERTPQAKETENRH